MYSPFKKEKLSKVAKVQIIGCCKWGGEYSIKKKIAKEKKGMVGTKKSLYIYPFN